MQSNGRLRRLARKWEGIARPNRAYQELGGPEHHKRSFSTPSIPDEWHQGIPDLPRLDTAGPSGGGGAVHRRRSRDSCRSEDWGNSLWEAEVHPGGGGGGLRGAGEGTIGGMDELGGGGRRTSGHFIRGSMGRASRSLSSSSSERGGMGEGTSGRTSASDMSSPISTEGDLGHLVTVLVGRNRTPFTVNASYLNHSCLRVLVDEARRLANSQRSVGVPGAGWQGGGGGQEAGGGHLWLDCEEVLFEHLLWLLNNADLKMSDGGMGTPPGTPPYRDMHADPPLAFGHATHVPPAYHRSHHHNMPTYEPSLIDL